MRAEITCSQCGDFQKIVDFRDDFVEVAKNFGSDTIANHAVTLMGLMSHHRETRPNGGFGGHDTFLVRLIVSGEWGTIRMTEDSDWRFQLSE